MDFFSIFDFYLKMISVSLSKEQKEKFYIFHNFLIQNNQKLNLTRIYNLEEMIRKHYIDSLMILPILKQSSIFLQSPIMDLGTGAGFPGIPLAILNPELQFLLVESRKNRVQYLNELKKQLQLNNIEVIHKTLTFKISIPASIVLTRAVESIKKTAIRTSSSLKKDGLLIFLKGPNCQSEIEEMNFLFYKKILDYNYSLPEPLDSFQSDLRKLVVFKKMISPDQASLVSHRLYFKVSQYIPIREIYSKENPFFKEIKKLSSSKEIKKRQKTLIAGEKLIKEFIQQYPHKIESFIFSRDLKENQLYRYYQEIKNQNIPFIYFDPSLLGEMEWKEYPSPYLLVKIPAIQSLNDIFVNEKFIILPLQDPLNLGSCIRSAYAFGIRNIFLTKVSCNPFLFKSVRSSAGSVFHCKFYWIENLSDFLLSSSVPIYILDIKGKNILKEKTNSIYGVLLGEEGKGIPENIKNIEKQHLRKITIPIHPSLDSLNVSVSCGIALFYLEKITDMKF